MHRNDVIVTKLQESIRTANPNVAFSILHELISASPGEAVLFAEHLKFVFMDVVLPIFQFLRISDAYYSRAIPTRQPQGSISIEEQFRQIFPNDCGKLGLGVPATQRNRSYLARPVIR